MKKYLILPLSLLAIYSCDEREVETFDDKNYVTLTYGLMDTTRLSFFFFFEDVVDYPIEVNLVGKTLKEDVEYNVILDKSVTDAPSHVFSMPERFVFRKDQQKDTFYITLKNNPELKTKEYTISYRIVDTDQLLSVGDILGRSVLTISDKSVRPKWWTTSQEVERNSFETTYLGKYSDAKYELFMQVTGIIDMGVLTPEEQRIHSIVFKRYLKAQNPPIFDDVNGEFMQVTVSGD